MRATIAKAGVLGAVICGLFAGGALSAPVPGKPPSISGKPNYGSLLTCHRGTWSSDAVSFDYAWTYSGGGPTIAAGPTLHVPLTVISYAITCVVTAHDAQGQTTSATSSAVVIGQGISTLRILKASVKHGVVKISAVAGPSAALKSGHTGSPYVVLDRRLNQHTVLQLTGTQVVRNRKGRFTISAHDTRGRHTYIVTFVPAAATAYAPATATRQLRVH